MSDIEKAIRIATKAHKGQKDKYGHPYVQHVLRVMQLGRTEEERIVGVLHDVVEDSDWTLSDLKAEGFSDRVLAAIDCLTKRPDEEDDYDAFIARIRKNKLAVRVKLNDLTDNMDVRRMDEFREKDVKRFNKYLRAYKLLLKDLD